MTVVAVVLAAGGSRRLGKPKQVLAYRGSTLLDHVLGTAREAAVDQVVVTLGGAEPLVRARVDLSGVEVVSAPDFAEGCAASVRAAVAALRPEVTGAVLLLGDQPGVTTEAVAALISGVRSGPTPPSVAVCRYDDGLGHPLWFDRSMFPVLAELHGDKAVWKLVDHAEDLLEVVVTGRVPRDVDTQEDYEALLGEDRSGAPR